MLSLEKSVSKVIQEIYNTELEESFEAINLVNVDLDKQFSALYGQLNDDKIREEIIEGQREGMKKLTEQPTELGVCLREYIDKVQAMLKNEAETDSANSGNGSSAGPDEIDEGPHVILDTPSPQTVKGAARNGNAQQADATRPIRSQSTTDAHKRR